MANVLLCIVMHCWNKRLQDRILQIACVAYKISLTTIKPNTFIKFLQLSLQLRRNESKKKQFWRNHMTYVDQSYFLNCGSQRKINTSCVIDYLAVYRVFQEPIKKNYQWANIIIFFFKRAKWIQIADFLYLIFKHF